MADSWLYRLYSWGMKTAVSIPDEVFQEAEALADRLGWSRSQLYAHAVRLLIEAQGADPVTAALNDLADSGIAEAAPTVGRSLIDVGAWEW